MCICSPKQNANYVAPALWCPHYCGRTPYLKKIKIKKSRCVVVVVVVVIATRDSIGVLYIEWNSKGENDNTAVAHNYFFPPVLAQVNCTKKNAKKRCAVSGAYLCQISVIKVLYSECEEISNAFTF